MLFDLSGSQRQLRDLADEFGRREIAPHVASYDREERFPREVIQKAIDLGLIGGVVPQAYGGAGLDYMTYTIMIEALARYCQVVAMVMTLPSGLVGAGLLRHGTEEQKQKYLVPLAQGRVFAAGAVTEPHSGTDVAGMETSAVRKGDTYVLRGNKIWISMLREADWFLTFASIDRSKRHRGICAFIVEKSLPGVSVNLFRNKVGFRPLSSGELVLEEVPVPAENMVGKEGEGFRVAMAAVEAGRLGVAARAVGMTQACLDAALPYARERIVFDQPIGRYQLIQSMITDMVVGLESARFFAYRLAQLLDRGVPRAQREASIAKMHATDVLMKAATDAVQIHGAYGCSDEYPVGRYFRDAKFFQIIEGTNQIHRTLIAEYALGYRR